MYKIGILTHYYNSSNYGGLLQSYALLKVINKMKDLKAEQICFNYKTNISFFGQKENNALSNHCFFKFFNPRNYYNKTKTLTIKLYCKLLQKSFLTRKEIMRSFEKDIAHSKNIYSSKDIQKVNSIYDIFITGSDQVWNLDWFTPTFFLEFVNNSKKRVSYAASVGHSKLSKDRIDYFKKVLPTFDSVSVREKDSVDLLQPLTDKKIEWVLDPTLLLDREDWDEICPERRINEKYLFCYFLGRDKSIRKLAEQYAKKHRLKIVNLPHMTGFCKADVGFGHYKLYDVAPDDFMSLIKHSECVFTDSFHACVFSCVYNKNFYVFNRLGSDNMAARIYSLCELFECQNHFCDTDDKFSLSYIENISPMSYNKKYILLTEMKEKSVKFLQDALSNE